MADNTVLLPGAGGDTIRDIDKGANGKTQVVVLDLGGSGAESLLTGTLPVSMAAIPVGGSTSALQTTGNTSVASIDTKTPALGQALAAASVPVVLTAAQITTLTPIAGLTDAQLRASVVPTSTTDTSGSGNLTALNQAVTLTALAGKTTGLIQLSGTWVGSVQFEGSNDAFVTTTILSTTQSGGAAPSTNPITTTGDFRALGVVNYASVRIRCSAYTSGTIVAFLKVSDANGIQPVISTNALGFLVTASQGGTWNVGTVTAVTAITNALPTGANTIGAVTAPGAAALALDATLTGGTAKAINRGGAKGTTVAADVTSNPVDANTQALHVNLVGTNAVNATLSAETTKVIGTINIAAAQTVGLVAGAAIIGAVTQSGTWAQNLTQYGSVAVGAANAVHVQAGTGATFVVTQATPANLQCSATQVLGTAATRWFAQISDGTTSPAGSSARTSPSRDCPTTRSASAIACGSAARSSR